MTEESGRLNLSDSLAGLDLAVPTRLAHQLEKAVAGEFEIIRLIARGGMGIVFLARDLSLQREVAIKVLLADAFTTKSEITRFKLEAQTVAALNHPNIVPIYAVREHEDLLLYIMQYVDGETLEQMVAKGPLPFDQVTGIIAMVSDALDHAHEKDIVHRDVKPANIILDRRGRAYVMDFGIAQLPDQRGLTVAGSLVGTPNYASPEQCRGERAGPLSDQYSLGVVAYEMIAGRPMFSADTITGIIQHHLQTDPAPLSDLRPDCPVKLAHAVQRMVEKIPEARWPHLSDAVTYLADESGFISNPGMGLGWTPRPSAERVQADSHTGDATTTEKKPESGARSPAVLTGIALGVLATVAALIGVMSVGSAPELSAGGAAMGAPTPTSQPMAPASSEGAAADDAPPDAGAEGEEGTPGAAEGRLDGTGPGTAQPQTDPARTDPARTDPTQPAATQPAATRSEPPVRSAEDPPPSTGTPTAGALRAEPTSPSEPPPAVETAGEAEPGSVLLGTRGLAAVLYVNDVPQGAASRLRSWPLDAGTVELSLRVDGCAPWDSTVVVVPGEEIRLGYRLRSCGRQE